ncbi:hypothetical protein DPMN_080391 [Dreissena polymorpha]|uniref:Uncharacterized protein n=1 Tax=Dreissena polymorpha TaxID=45954 RepID=A0A9D3YQT0_DREPO|nr:hypothetical protein DPMN_080391 [Dreissena polymorpha]
MACMSFQQPQQPFRPKQPPNRSYSTGPPSNGFSGISISEHLVVTQNAHSPTSVAFVEVHMQHTTVNSATKNRQPKPSLNQTSTLLSQQSNNLVVTPIKVSALTPFLQDYPLAQYLILGFTHGFKLGYTGQHKASTSPNLKSCDENPDKVQSKLQAELNSGRVSDERSTEVKDEIVARNQVIVYLNRSIESLEYLQTTPGTSSTDYDIQINQLSVIKQKHCQLLQTRFEEVDLCLHQQKQECKTQEDNLLKHKTETAKLGLTGTLQCSSFDTTRIRTPDASNEMYTRCLIEQTFDDTKETLNGVYKQERSIIEIQEDIREHNALLRELLVKVNAISQLEHGTNLDLLMKVRTTGSRNNEEMDGEMVAAGNGLLNGVQLTDSRGRQMQNAFRPVVRSIEKDGNTVTRISHGCMAIHICCRTVNHLIALCEDFLNGNFSTLFQPLQDYLRTFPGNEDVVVVVDIFEKDYIKSIMPILNEIRQKLDIKVGELVSPSSVVQDSTLQNVQERWTTTPDENANDPGLVGAAEEHTADLDISRKTVVSRPHQSDIVQEKDLNTGDSDSSLTELTIEQELGIPSPERMCLDLQKQAHVLEKSYSSVAKFPAVARKIREAAFEAKSHQMLARGVVKSIGMTSRNIYAAMIPIVLKAILEKDEELISKAIATTVGFIKDAEKKTRDLSERYEELDKTLGNVVEVMKEEKLNRAKEEGRLQIEIVEQNKQAQVMQTALTRVNEERKRMIDGIRSQQQARDKLIKQIAKKGKEETDSAFWLGLVGSIIGGICTVAATIVAAPVSLAVAGSAAGSAVTLGSSGISAWAQRKANNESINQMSEQLTQSESSVRQGYQELRVIDDRQTEKEKALHAHARKAEECQLQIEYLCDERSLTNAIEYTRQLYGQLDFFTMFFGDLKSAFGLLEDEFIARNMFANLKDESYVTQLRDICNKATKKWESLSRTCGIVEAAITANIGKNFAFLSKNYDTPTDDEKNKPTLKAKRN